jgi:hypothetical protein
MATLGTAKELREDGRDNYWKLDSGATCHIANSSEDFDAATLKLLGESVMVRVGNGALLEATHAGSVTIPTQLAGVSLVLHGVLLVEECPFKLLSTHELTRAGLELKLTSQGAILSRSGDAATLLVFPKARSGLYTLYPSMDRDCRYPRSSGALNAITVLLSAAPSTGADKVDSRGIDAEAGDSSGVAASSSGGAAVRDAGSGETDASLEEAEELTAARAGEAARGARNGNTATAKSKVELWHRRLGHPGKSSLVEMLKRGVVTGVDATSAEVQAEDLERHCSSCWKGKQTAGAHPTSSSPKPEPLEVIHFDLCYIPSRGRAGEQYFLGVLDEGSNVVKAVVLKSKAEAGEALMDSIAELEALSGRRVWRARCDNGGEFDSGWLKDQLLAKGIILQCSAPYVHQQNGHAERLNRRLLSIMRSLLADQEVSHGFWPEALDTAVYLHNRTCSSRHDMTPWEKLTGVKPDLSHLRVWGCKVGVHVPLELQENKLDGVSEEGRFVGYDTFNPKAYKVWVNGAVKIRSDVVFDERPVTKREEPHFNAPADVSPGQPKPQPPAPSPSPSPAVQAKAPPLRTVATTRPRRAAFNKDYKTNQVKVVPTPGTLLLSNRFEALADLPEEPDERRASPLDSVTDNQQDSSCEGVEELLAAVADAGDPDEPKTFQEAVSGPFKEQWIKSIQEELDGIKEKGTWREVLTDTMPPGQRPLGSKWVFKIKRGPTGEISRFKSRLVVKGYMQKAGIDYQEIFSPVGSAAAFRVLVGLAAQQGLKIHQIDFKQAFLNGVLQEEVYLQPPEGVPISGEGEVVLKLEKALYGLKQAPKEWHDLLKGSLLGMGFTQSQADPGVFMRGGIILLLYVDDQLIFGKEVEEIQSTIREIGEVFEITDMGPATFFLGVDILRSGSSITLSQKRYTAQLLEQYRSELEKQKREASTPSERPIAESGSSVSIDQGKYASLVGALLYLAVWTRPDISYAVGKLTRSIATPTAQNWTEAVRVLRYLRSTAEDGITFSGAGHVIGYCDADYASEPSRKSISGMVFLFGGGAVSWKSKQQPTIALSTCEAEFMAMNLACREALWLRKFLPELGVPLGGGAMEILNDNVGALELSKNPILSNRSKHIDVIHMFARERVERKEVSFSFVSSEENLADMFTKSVPPSVFDKLRNLVMGK